MLSAYLEYVTPGGYGMECSCVVSAVQYVPLLFGLIVAFAYKPVFEYVTV